MRSFSLLWRLVRRGTVLNRSQAALVIALIALPMLGLSGSVLVIQSRQATDAEALTALLGENQSQVRVVGAPDPTRKQTPPGSDNWEVQTDSNGRPVHENPDEPNPPIESLLPAGTRVLRVADASVSVTSKTGIADLPVTLGPVWDPSFRGRFSVVEGHTPQNAHELMVTAPTLKRLGVKLGDEVRLRSPIEGTYTVTGLIADTRSPQSAQTVFLPDGAFDGSAAEPAPDSYTYYLPALDVSAAQAVALNHAGYVVNSRALAAQYGISQWWNTIRAYDSALWILLGVALLFGAFLAVLLAGSAFVIGARQRQRVLAVIASTGAPRGVMFGLLSATGAALGALGGLLGAAGGLGAGLVYLRLTSDGSAAHYPGVHVTWWLYAVVVAFAALVGFLAALLPAITVSRLDVVAALRGARRPMKLRKRRPIIGGVIAAVGVAGVIGAGFVVAGIEQGWFSGTRLARLVPGWVDVYAVTQLGMAAGVIVLQIGLIVASGLILAGVQLALRRSGISARLASRDLGRNRSRAVPAIASIMATSFLAVLVMEMIASGDASSAVAYRWSAPDRHVVGWVSQGEGTSAQREQKLSELTSAMHRTLDLGKPTVISSPRTAVWQEDLSKDAGLYPAPMVPTANACLDPESGAYVSPDRDSPDWRCNDLGVDAGTWDLSIPRLVVGDADVLEALIGQKPSAAAVAALAHGDAVSLHRAYVDAGDVLKLGWYTAEATLNPIDTETTKVAEPRKTASVPVVYQATEPALAFGVVLSPAAAKRLGIVAEPSNVIAPLMSRPTAAQRDALMAATVTLEQDGTWGLQALVETGPGVSPPIYLWGLLGVSSLIAVAAAVVALTLARQDGARDSAVLHAVGASPGVRRRLAFWQGVVVVGSGAVLGTFTATLAAYAIFGIPRSSVFALPWVEVLAGTVGLTLVIACGAWVAAGTVKPVVQSRRAL